MIALAFHKPAGQLAVEGRHLDVSALGTRHERFGPGRMGNFMRVPSTSLLTENGDEDMKVVEFGELFGEEKAQDEDEAVIIFLNGTSLPVEVYGNCDTSTLVWGRCTFPGI